MIIFFLFKSTSTKTSSSFHSTLSFLLLSYTHLFLSPQVSSPLTERAVSHAFLVLKRAFLLLSNGCLPSDMMPHPPTNATLVSPDLGSGISAFRKHHWFLMESRKDWHPSAVQRKAGVRNRSLSLAICVALDQARSEHSYLQNVEVWGRLNDAPPIVHTLISETDDCYLIWWMGLYRYNCVNQLEMGRLSWWSWCTRSNPNCLYKKDPEVSQRRRAVTKEAHVGMRSFEDRSSIHKLTNRGIH